MKVRSLNDIAALYARGWHDIGTEATILKNGKRGTIVLFPNEARDDLNEFYQWTNHAFDLCRIRARDRVQIDETN